MKLILACLMLISISVYAHSSEISCYSGKARIYHGYASDIVYNEYFVKFTELKTKKEVFVSGDCVIIM